MPPIEFRLSAILVQDLSSIKVQWLSACTLSAPRYVMNEFSCDDYEQVPCSHRLPQWRNWLAHGTYMTVSELCRGCEFEPHLGKIFNVSMYIAGNFT